MRALLESCKDNSYTETTVTIKSALTDANRAAIAQLADELLA